MILEIKINNSQYMVGTLGMRSAPGSDRSLPRVDMEPMHANLTMAAALVDDSGLHEDMLPMWAGLAVVVDSIAGSGM